MEASIVGLTFANFNEIPDIGEKLSTFFRETQEIAGSEGLALIPRPIAGYACLDGEQIVAISYYIIPKKLSLNYLLKYVFQPVKVETGTVINKKYRSRGVYRELIRRVEELMQNKGYVKA